MLASYGSLQNTEQFIHVRAAKLLQKLNVRRKNWQIITVLVEEKVKRKIFSYLRLSHFENVKILDCYVSCLAANAGKQKITLYPPNSTSIWKNPACFLTLMQKASA